MGRASTVEADAHWQIMACDRQDEDAYLRDLAGVESLVDASSLRMTVNTSTGASISHLGPKLPHLHELNLSGSILESMRDLGTGFRSLQVLWVSRCSLPGLDGLSALPALRELYASYNDIADLQPLDACSELEVLDMEGNCVSELEGLHALAAGCPRLMSLSLAGTPLASSPEYRETAVKLLPTLQFLDDSSVADQAPEGHLGSGREDGPMRPNVEEGFRPGSAGALAEGELNGIASEGPLSISGGSMQSPSGGMGRGDPAGGSGGDSELRLVLDGIKHARVGVDSAEFRELEMTLLMAAELPPEDAPPPGATMLPASASGWMRCSQQGSLPSLSRSRSVGGHEAASSPRATSSGGSGGTSRFAPPGGGGPGRPNSSGTQSSAAGSVLRRNSSGNGRPPTSRPFSARLGTASVTGRPTTAVAGSAPPTAGGGTGGGLYWRKHRIGASGPGAGSGGKAVGAIPTVEDDEDADSASALTFGGTGGASIGGSLAKDLRRRRRAAAMDSVSSSVMGGGIGGGGGSSLLDMAGNRVANSPIARTAIVATSTAPVSTSYNSAALLEELRRWKVGRTMNAVQGWAV